MDRLTPTQRRRCMQANRGVDTSPELALRKALFALGFRYVLGSKLPGRPDIVFPSRRVVVFVDGCFWHGCPDHFVAPKTNAAAWQSKIEANKSRDLAVDTELSARGWQVIRVWEHDVRRSLLETVARVSKVLKRGRTY